MSQALKNKVFISTRPEGQSDELAKLIEGEGATLIEMPLIKIQPAELSGEEKNLLNTLENFQWLIFTSPNGVRYFFEYLAKNINQSIPESVQIGVIGHKTEQVLKLHGYQADFVNPGNTGEEFADAFSEKIKDQSNKPAVLLSVGNLARNVIQNRLKKYANCVRINIYETVSPDKVDENIADLIKRDQYEMIIFTSPSGIENFSKLTTDIEKDRLRIACIGNVTANSAKKNGISPAVVANEASAKGLVQSIIEYYEQN